MDRSGGHAEARMLVSECDVSARSASAAAPVHGVGVQVRRGKARICSRAWMKVVAQGQRSGRRKTMAPLRLTRRPGGRAPGAHGAGNGELIVGMDVAELGTPADEVVGEDGAGEPGCIGEEVARGAVLEARSFFEVADGELDAGVVAVEDVGLDVFENEVGDEGVVTPLGPQGRLVRIGQSRAAHDQTQLASLAAHPGDVGRLGDLGQPGVGIGDGAPCRLVDGVDAGPDLGVDGDRDGVGHAQAHQGVDERVGEEPGIGPQVSAPVAPARRTRAMSSSTNRLWPRWEDPLRSRAWSTSPVLAQVAMSG